MVFLVLLLCMAAPAKTRACELALMLAVDVSGSVDRDEYAIQMQGLALGLRDPVVSEALVNARAKVAVMQWTGSSRQAMLVPWTDVTGFAQLDGLAAEVGNLPRRWRNYATAIGDAQIFALGHFLQVADCKARVIDISGDGISNEGVEPAAMREKFRAEGILVNALAIEGAEEDLTGYFYENVISGPGAFVVTANGFDEFPEKMRQKMRRETTLQMSDAHPSFGPGRARLR